MRAVESLVLLPRAIVAGLQLPVKGAVLFLGRCQFGLLGGEGLLVALENLFVSVNRRFVSFEHDLVVLEFQLRQGALGVFEQGVGRLLTPTLQAFQPCRVLLMRYEMILVATMATVSRGVSPVYFAAHMGEAERQDPSGPAT